jgi:hypothetical protein
LVTAFADVADNSADPAKRRYKRVFFIIVLFNRLVAYLIDERNRGTGVECFLCAISFLMTELSGIVTDSTQDKDKEEGTARAAPQRL